MMQYGVVGILALVLFSGCITPRENGAPEKVPVNDFLPEPQKSPEASGQHIADTGNKKTTDPALEGLKAELQVALASGGISPEKYTEIENRSGILKRRGTRRKPKSSGTCLPD